MMTTKPSFSFTNLTISHPKRTRRNTINILAANKRDLSGNSRTQQQPANSFPLRLPKTILARSVVAVLGLGFVDAGYSGDWSRIGVISKETEDLLKIAAFVVVPLCFVLVFYSEDSREEEV